MKLKVCGMKLNITEVAALGPDYLGFIFWESSSRFFNGEIPALPRGIAKVGVFVDASVEEILDRIEKYDLQGVQLHGNENPEFCNDLRIKSSAYLGRSNAVNPPRAKTNLEIIKVFSIKKDFDFSLLDAYEEVCDYYLFDTKGKFPGGNGHTFDWSILKNYPSTKPYFLSGGIGPEDVEAIKEFMKCPKAENCYALDVNSKFEIEPGLKDIKRLKEFRDVAGSHLFW